MGCDIKAYIEDDCLNEGFQYKGRVPCSRNYNLFGILAGIRIPVVPIKPLGGLPTDCSKKVVREYKSRQSDAHSMTWYDVNELFSFVGPVEFDPDNYFASWFAVINRIPGPDDDYSPKDILKDLADFNTNIKEMVGSNQKATHRVVIWFNG